MSQPLHIFSCGIHDGRRCNCGAHTEVLEREQKPAQSLKRFDRSDWPDDPRNPIPGVPAKFARFRNGNFIDTYGLVASDTHGIVGAWIGFRWAGR